MRKIVDLNPSVYKALGHLAVDRGCSLKKMMEEILSHRAAAYMQLRIDDLENGEGKNDPTLEEIDPNQLRFY